MTKFLSNSRTLYCFLSNRRWFRFSLQTLFLVVTAAALWLGWNVNIIQQRKVMLQEIRSEGDARWRILKEHFLRPHVGAGMQWKEERLQAPTNAQLPFIRRWLGDAPVGRPITRNTKADALRSQALFPEARIHYYVGTYESMPWQDNQAIERAFRAASTSAPSR